MAWKIETAALAGVAASMSGDQLLAGVGRAGSRRSKARYGEELGASCWAEFAQKRMTAEKAEQLNDLLADRWPAIRDRVRSVLLTTERLTQVLKAAGADLTPDAIHLPRGFYETALLRCREIRNRYTFLDLAAGAGKLAGLVSEL